MQTITIQRKETKTEEVSVSFPVCYKTPGAFYKFFGRKKYIRVFTINNNIWISANEDSPMDELGNCIGIGEQISLEEFEWEKGKAVIILNSYL